MDNTQGFIERGRVTSVTDTGCIIASCDRDGIVSPPLTPINNVILSQGDLVLFVLFKDGTGRIISKA